MVSPALQCRMNQLNGMSQQEFANQIGISQDKVSRMENDPYILQNYPSLNAYFEDILTREEILDISPYKKRFVYVQMFGQKLTELKHSLQIIEFEPNQIVNFRRLELRYKVQGSDVYFDPILERFYADVKLYERELDAAEDMAQ